MLTRIPLLLGLLGWCGTADDGAVVAGAPSGYSELTIHRTPRPLAMGAVTDDWPSYLGPSYDAVSRERPLQKNWPAEGPALVWEMKAGSGYAGPAVQGDRLVYFHRVGNEAVVDCLHAETGRRFWRFAYPSTYRDRFGFNNGPRSSPIIADGLVYTHGAEGKLHCLDLESGRKIWAHDTVMEYGIDSTYFGVGSTPLVEGDLLIVTVGAPGPGVVAYERRSGKVAWKTAGEWAGSYASPIPATIRGRRRVMVFAGGDSRPPTGGLLSVDPASGSVDFRFPWRPERYESVNAASPVIIGDRVFVTSAYRKGGALVEIQADGTCKPAWTTMELKAHWATPVYRQGHLYGFDGDGQGDTAIVCLDAVTGRALWREQLEWEDTVERDGQPDTLNMGLMRGSMLWADGHFLALGEMGHLAWLDLTLSGCKLISRSWLFPAPESYTLPVLSRGLLYVTQNKPGLFGRTAERLLCYDLRGK